MNRLVFIVLLASMIIATLIVTQRCELGLHEEDDEVIVSGWSGVTLVNLGVSNCKYCDKHFIFQHTLGGATGNVKRQRRAVPEDMYSELRIAFSSSIELEEAVELLNTLAVEYGVVEG